MEGLKQNVSRNGISIFLWSKFTFNETYSHPHKDDIVRSCPKSCYSKYVPLPGAGILHIECIVHIAYWVQHFPQHHLSGSGIAQLEFYHCREPAWGTPPMANVTRKEARHTQRRDRASGVPLEILEHLPPKPESAYFLLCAFTYTSDFIGAVPHYLSLKKELAYSSS